MTDFIAVVGFVEIYRLLCYWTYVHDEMCNPVKYMVVCGMCCDGLILTINLIIFTTDFNSINCIVLISVTVNRSLYDTIVTVYVQQQCM